MLNMKPVSVLFCVNMSHHIYALLFIKSDKVFTPGCRLAPHPLKECHIRIILTKLYRTKHSIYAITSP